MERAELWRSLLGDELCHQLIQQAHDEIAQAKLPVIRWHDEQIQKLRRAIDK